MSAIVVRDYDPNWPAIFEQLRCRLWNAVEDIAESIEHVGSTSVPGLAAKPIIDIDIVVHSKNHVPNAIERLSEFGYIHLGDLGIEGREAFSNPPGCPAHHLYVCPQGSLGLRNHLAVRAFLRCNPTVARDYGELKKALARRCDNDLDSYIDGKTDFLLQVLRNSTLSTAEMEQIEVANRKS